MAVTKTDLTKIMGEITAVVDTVESGIGYMYFGTSKGILYKYRLSTGAMTVATTVSGPINCILYDSSTYLYFGTGDGVIYRYTWSSGALTALYTSETNGIESITYYGTTLYVGMSGGKFASVTTS
jgi:hypothetical protein